METTIDPELREVDQRVAHLKHSLKARVEELGRRLQRVKRDASVKSQITRHAWPAVGVAFAVGMLVAASRRRPRAQLAAANTPEHAPPDAGSSEPEGLRHLVVASLGAVALRLIKRYVANQLVAVANNWIAPDHEAPRP